MQLESPIIRTWGAWGAVLIAIGIFIWKWVLPRVDRYLEDRRQEKREQRESIRKRDEEFVEMIKESLEGEQATRAAERDKFVSVLDGSLKQQTEALQTLAEAVNESLKARKQ